MRTKFGLAGTALLVSMVAVSSSVATAGATATQPVKVSQLVKVVWPKAAATNLSIVGRKPATSYSKGDCLRPLKGQTEYRFYVNYHAFNYKSRVHGLRLGMQSASHDRFGADIPGRGCRQVTKLRLSRQRSGVQTVFTIGVALRAGETLSPLRVDINGHKVRVDLRPHCEPYAPSQSPDCAPYPIVRITR